jgi:hypothetical protein
VGRDALRCFRKDGELSTKVCRWSPFFFDQHQKEDSVAYAWKGHQIKHFGRYIGAKMGPDDVKALESLAQREQASLSEMIRRLIAREHARQLAADGAHDQN